MSRESDKVRELFGKFWDWTGLFNEPSEITEDDAKSYGLRRAERAGATNIEKAQSWKNKGTWESSAAAAKANPNVLQSAEGAEHARNLRDAMGNRVAMEVSEAEHVLKRHKQRVDIARKNAYNHGPAMSATNVNSKLAEWDKNNPSPKQLQKKYQTILNGLVGYAERQPGDYRSNYGKAVNTLNSVKGSAEYVTGAGENYGKLLGDEGYGHVKNLNAFARDREKMRMLEQISPEQYKQLVDKRGLLNFAVNNRSSLQDLWNFKQNPFMWLIRSIFSRNPQRFYGAVRNLHSAYTDPNSDWSRYVGGIGLNNYSAYMPMLRLLHNVRGTVGGDPNFKPIYYRG